jgi:FtsH-binding integral membrane protein
MLVFANLFIQLGISYYVMIHTNNVPIGHWYLIGILIIIITLLSFVPMPSFMKFILFTIFSYTFGLSLSHYKKKVDERAIHVAIKSSLSLFGLMIGVGIALMLGGINLGQRFGAFLFWSLLLLIILQIISIVGDGLSMMYKVFTFVGIILFSLFIVYDTHQILSRNYDGDFITASMAYYLDIINLFTRFVRHDN